jgi:DNA-binding CsgD family transcriptional regulator
VSITVCLGRDASSGRRFSSRERAALETIEPVANALVRRNWKGLQASEPSGEAVSDHLRKRVMEAKGIALSPRQSEVALLILQGHSSISIGLTLGISPQTVKVLRKQLYRKCNISSQAELFALLVPYLATSP